jgi:hypothetical protein
MTLFLLGFLACAIIDLATVLLFRRDFIDVLRRLP